MTRSNEPQDVGGRLRVDMKSAEVSGRRLAKLLAGESATHEDVEQLRRYVSRWRNLTNGRGLRTDWAERVAGSLGTDPSRYVSPKYDVRQKLERKIHTLESELREARHQLARLR